MLRWSSFRLSLPLLLALPLVACGSGTTDDSEGTPEATATPGVCTGDAANAAARLPHTWGLMRQVEQEVLVGSSWEPQTTWNYVLVTWDIADDGTITQHETLCSSDVSELTLLGGTTQETKVPQTLLDTLPENKWKVSLEVAEGDATGQCTVNYTMEDSEFGPQYSVWGAELLDPVTGTCPTSPEDPTQYDQDGDGNPGVSVQLYVDNEYSADVYVCQRTIWRQEAAAISLEGESYQISAQLTDMEIDQSQFGSSKDIPLTMDPQVKVAAGPTTFYRMVPLANDATCADVDPDIF